MTDSNFRSIHIGAEEEGDFSSLDKPEFVVALEDLRDSLKKREGLEALRALAAAFDAVGPEKWSKAAWSWYYDKKKARARLDPTWRAIDDRRKNDHGTITFLSDDLTMDDYRAQRRIEDELTPEPDWVKFVRGLDRFSAGGLVGRVIGGFQRARRGWGERDVWSMDNYLARVTGEMLLHLANTTHGWPGSDEFPTFEGWQETLREKGEALGAWAKGEGHSKELHAWYELSCDQTATKDEVDTAWKAMNAADEARYAAAKAAMVWVGEHLGQIWD